MQPEIIFKLVNQHKFVVEEKDIFNKLSISCFDKLDTTITYIFLRLISMQRSFCKIKIYNHENVIIIGLANYNIDMASFKEKYKNYFVGEGI